MKELAVRFTTPGTSLFSPAQHVRRHVYAEYLCTLSPLRPGQTSWVQERATTFELSDVQPCGQQACTGETSIT